MMLNTLFILGEPSQKATWVRYEDLNDTANNL